MVGFWLPQTYFQSQQEYKCLTCFPSSTMKHFMPETCYCKWHFSAPEILFLPMVDLDSLTVCTSRVEQEGLTGSDGSGPNLQKHQKQMGLFVKPLTRQQREAEPGLKKRALWSLREEKYASIQDCTDNWRLFLTYTLWPPEAPLKISL